MCHHLYRAALNPDLTRVKIGEQELELAAALRDVAGLQRFRDRPVIVGIRPEDMSSVEDGEGSAPASMLQGNVDLVESLGSEKLVHFRLDAERVGDLAGAATDETGEGLDAGELGASAAAVGTARVAATSRLRDGESGPSAREDRTPAPVRPRQWRSPGRPGTTQQSGVGSGRRLRSG